MRRRFLSTLIMAVVVALFAVACSDQPAGPDPMEPPVYTYTHLPAACNVLRTTVLITALYPPNRTRLEAYARYGILLAYMSHGQTAQAATAMFGLVEFTLDNYEAGRLQDPPRFIRLTTVQAVSELTVQLYNCAGMANQAPPDMDDVLESGGGAGIVYPSTDPEPQVVATSDGHAVASFPPGAVSVPVLVLIAPDPTGQSPFPHTFTEYEPFFDFSTSPHVERFGALVTVGICVSDERLTAVIFQRLQIAHPDPDDPETLELLPRVAPPPDLVCASSGSIGSAPRTPNGWLPMLGSMARRAVGLFAPDQLHAAVVEFEGGLGGTTDSFTGFRAVDPGSGEVSIDDVELSSTTLTIGGPNVDYTATFTNGTGETLSGVVLQGYIDQGETTSRAAGGVVVLCDAGQGILPPGPCSQDWSLGASNGAAGNGTLVPGSATARITLIQGGENVLATFTIPVTLVAPAPGTLLDGSGDAGNGADFSSLSTSVSDGMLTLSARFAGTTYGSATYVAWNLDTDQNIATGFGGITAGHADADQIGTDYLVFVGGTEFGSLVQVLRANEGGSFTNISNGVLIPTYVSNGVDVTLPLSLLAEEGGAMNFKATVQTQISVGSWTGINDFISNLGLPPGTVVP